MKTVETQYGILEGVTEPIYYKSGKIRSCKLEIFNQIVTPAGVFVPQYGEMEARTRFREAISFYETGELKSVYLKEHAKVDTVVGLIKSEFITFYKEGTIHRIFPLYGQISGYWSEKEEYQMAEQVTFNIGDLEVVNKINSYCFYPSGNLKSLSLWQKEILMTKLYKKNIAVRLGIAFYENGKIKSLEPYVPTYIKTSIGNIMAYNNEAVGIHGDTNSLILDESGNVKGITTTSTVIKLKDLLGKEKIIAPHLVRSQLDIDKWVIKPITISFLKDLVIIIDQHTSYRFNKADYEWQTMQIGFEEFGDKCSDCVGCKGCL